MYRQRIESLLQEWEQSTATTKAEATNTYNLSQRKLQDQYSELVQAKGRISELEKELKSVRDEYNSFMTVSRVVAITNENTRLKETVRLLERSALKNKADTGSNTYITPVLSSPHLPSTPTECEMEKESEKESASEREQDNDVSTQEQIPLVEEKVKEEPPPAEQQLELDEAEPEQDIEVYEKTIKGKLYYVGNDDQIYENIEGELGNPLGRYNIVNNKKKIEWY